MFKNLIEMLNWKRDDIKVSFQERKTILTLRIETVPKLPFRITIEHAIQEGRPAIGGLRVAYGSRCHYNHPDLILDEELTDWVSGYIRMKQEDNLKILDLEVETPVRTEHKPMLNALSIMQQNY